MSDAWLQVEPGKLYKLTADRRDREKLLVCFPKSASSGWDNLDEFLEIPAGEYEWEAVYETAAALGTFLVLEKRENATVAAALYMILHPELGPLCVLVNRRVFLFVEESSDEEAEEEHAL